MAEYQGTALVSVPIISGLLFQLNNFGSHSDLVSSVSVPIISGLLFQLEDSLTSRGVLSRFSPHYIGSSFSTRQGSAFQQQSAPVSVPIISGLLFQLNSSGGSLRLM